MSTHPWILLIAEIEALILRNNASNTCFLRRIQAIISAGGAENVCPRAAGLAPVRLEPGAPRRTSGCCPPPAGPADRPHGSPRVQPPAGGCAADPHSRCAQEQGD